MRTPLTTPPARRSILLAALAFAAASPLPAQQVGDLRVWTTRVGTTEGARVEIEVEEGHLWVPESWDEPSERLVRLHFYRFPATGADPGPPIVYLAGGPGGSGTVSAMGDRFGLFQALREHGDVIAFDQRGVYGSDPFLVCPNTGSYPLDQPEDHDLNVRLAREFARRCAAGLEARADLAAYHTRASVRDLDALREALGAERIALWGISYGTHLGLAAIRNLPGRIDRAILAGVEGPDHTVKLPSAWERSVAAVDSMVAADPEATAAFGGFRALVDRVLAMVEPPVAVPVGEDEVTIGRQDVIAFLLGELAEREDYAALPLALHRVAEGGLEPAARSIAAGRRGRRALAMMYAMDCASGVSEERWARVLAEAAASWLGEATLSIVPEACDAWPHTDLGPDFRADIRSDVPVLFISGSIDARTPASNAEEVAAGFPNGVHLVIEGAGHDDDLFLSSPEILDAMRAFLAGGTVPSRVVLPPLEFETP